MNHRDAVLSRIRSGLAHDGPRQRPAVPDVWPRENPTPEQMAARFAQELDAVHGETIRAGSIQEARRKLAELLEPSGWSGLGAVDRPLCRDLVAALAPGRVAWVAADWTPHQIAQLPAGLVAADYLLADTGSCTIANPTANDRLMCYLPPASIVVARTDQLFEHLPAAWRDVARRTADPEARGEFVFVTGPSRTADIEKILILGVHGPKRLIVLLIG
jgi:L-lactate dehydrogenase complex protein LldG